MTARILVVEDDRRVVDLLVALGKRQGWDIDVARDGEDAIARWRRHRPDLILLDLGLPGTLDGLDVFQELRRLGGVRPPTVLLTAAPDGVAVARKLGVPIVAKPFSLDELIKTMRTELERTITQP